ncbi:ASCH domain-containing protein [Burkholderia cepacia]|nr:ASCH domain-containing protein [Burkholderia cepacia]
MPRSALSIVKPAVDDIVAGRKRVEIRSWAPPAIPLRDLVLVQNTIFLRQDGQEDPDGIALAMVDVVGGARLDARRSPLARQAMVCRIRVLGTGERSADRAACSVRREARHPCVAG